MSRDVRQMAAPKSPVAAYEPAVAAPHTCAAIPGMPQHTIAKVRRTIHVSCACPKTWEIPVLVYRRWTVTRRKPRYASAGKSDHAILAVNRVMTGERRAWRREEVAHEEIGTAHRGGQPAGRSAGEGQDPVSRRAAIAAKARTNPKEQFNNLLHHLTYELVAECLAEIPRSSAAGWMG
jgi:hypothetical protein